MSDAFIRAFKAEMDAAAEDAWRDWQRTMELFPLPPAPPMTPRLWLRIRRGRIVRWVIDKLEPYAW